MKEKIEIPFSIPEKRQGKMASDKEVNSEEYSLKMRNNEGNTVKCVEMILELAALIGKTQKPDKK